MFVSLFLQENSFYGTISLTQLPSTLSQFELFNNELSGSIDLTQLPPPLQWLELSNNKFSGSIDLTQLPPPLQWLELSNNNFSGTLNLSSLPTGLIQLLLISNEFVGPIDFSVINETSMVYITLNESVYCLCDKNYYSMERTNWACVGRNGCLETCGICQMIPTMAPTKSPITQFVKKQ